MGRVNGISVTRLGTARAPSNDETNTSLGRFVRTEHWNGLEAGDVVRVAGHPSRGRHWRFKSHVTNTSNGASWVEVLLVEGPVPSRRAREAVEDGEPVRVERIRSFPPELVTPRWRRRGRRPDPGEVALF